MKTPSKSAADPGISSFRERPSQAKNDKVAVSIVREREGLAQEKVVVVLIISHYCY